MTVQGDLDRLAGRYRGRLVRTLAREGLLADQHWRAAFAEVPRHEFLPRFFRPVAPDGWAPVDLTDPGWLSLVYSNRVLVTQLDGDPTRWELARRTGEIRGVPTSSSSMPAIMAVMLEALGVRDGDRVLEIGTGTGYNAALLCHRIGSALVSTVDIDGTLVALAQDRLRLCGYTPTCVTTDGADGYPATAPYDRVLSTCAVSTIPLPWLDQTRPGGLVVTTLNRPLGAGLVRITAGAGACGRGRVLADDGRFMPLRAHRRILDQAMVDSYATASGTDRPTALPPAAVTSPSSPFEFFAGLALPGVSCSAPAEDITLLVHPDGSWARHHTERGRGTSGASGTVVQGGPRRLWDELETAHTRWTGFGQPRRSRFGITVDPTVQELWLDSPDSPHRWPLTAG